MHPRSNQLWPQSCASSGTNWLKCVGPSIGPARKPSRSAIASSCTDAWPPYSCSASIWRGWRNGPQSANGVSKDIVGNTWRKVEFPPRIAVSDRHFPNARPPRPSAAEALEHDLADGAPRLQERMGAPKIGRVDRPEMLGHGGADPAGVHQFRDRAEQPVLLDHVGRLHQRAGEHRFPVQ